MSFLMSNPLTNFLGSLFTWGSTTQEADPTDVIVDMYGAEDEIDKLDKTPPTLVKDPLDEHRGASSSTPVPLSDSLHVKEEVVSYPIISPSERSEILERMKEGKSIYPEISERKVEPFKFFGPTGVTKATTESDTDGFTLIGSSDSAFKKPSLPATGIPVPSSSTRASTGTSKTELESRTSEGKLVRWWGFFNRNCNGHSLVGYKEFWKAMKAFPFSHTAKIFHREDRDLDQHRRSLVAFNEAHGNYLEALEKPVKVLQSEVNGHSVEDQVKYFDAASREITDVTWVKENKLRRGKVERDFKSTALLSLIDSISQRIISSPPEALKVISYVNDHLLPFARLREEREDSKDGVYAQPIEHHVNEKREVMTLDIQSHRDLSQYKLEQSRFTLASPLAKQEFDTGSAIYGMIMQRTLPELNRIAPKTPEEFSRVINENLAATTQLLNDALEGKRPIDANWKRELRELSEEYDFQMWQNERLAPHGTALRGSLNSHSLAVQVQGIVFQYSMMKSSEERLIKAPKNRITRGVYLENVKKFRQAQPVLRGIVEAMGNKFDKVLTLNAALAFDPLSPDNPIKLTESDLA
ncbi:hypothetical protein [Simkania sp.]|uniref:hypothetical protein n=1 Tax=Simkania sp. TaxID=34094 RepID=UPI003B529887